MFKLVKLVWRKVMEVSRKIVSLIPENIRPIAEAAAALLVVFGCLIGTEVPVYLKVLIPLLAAVGVWWWYQRRSQKPEVK